MVTLQKKVTDRIAVAHTLGNYCGGRTHLKYFILYYVFYAHSISPDTTKEVQKETLKLLKLRWIQIINKITFRHCIVSKIIIK